MIFTHLLSEHGTESCVGTDGLTGGGEPLVKLRHQPTGSRWLAETAPGILKTGHPKQERCRSCRELVRDQVHHLARKAAHYRQPVSDAQFREELSVLYGLESGKMFLGRPEKHGELYKE